MVSVQPFGTAELPHKTTAGCRSPRGSGLPCSQHGAGELGEEVCPAHEAQCGALARVINGSFFISIKKYKKLTHLKLKRKVACLFFFSFFSFKMASDNRNSQGKMWLKAHFVTRSSMHIPSILQLWLPFIRLIIAALFCCQNISCRSQTRESFQ